MGGVALERHGYRAGNAGTAMHCAGWLCETRGIFVKLAEVYWIGKIRGAHKARASKTLTPSPSHHGGWLVAGVIACPVKHVSTGSRSSTSGQTPAPSI